MVPRRVLLLLLLLLNGVIVRGAILNDFIRHYEPVAYDVRAVQAQHSRVRRDAGPSRDVRLRFHASDRDFRLRLQPDREVFAPDVVFESNTGPVNFDTGSVYKGSLEDDDSAVVHGVISADGMFDGTIATASDHYYVEPSGRYFTDPQPFHSLVYRLSDVTQPERRGGGCASHSNATRDDVSMTSSDDVDAWLGHSQPYEAVAVPHPVQDADNVTEPGLRSRRAISKNKKTTCTLYLQADHLFYEQFGSEEASIDAMIRHVQQANEIYKAIDFDSDGIQDNIGFMIKRIRVHKPSAVNDVDYRFPGNYGVEKFLELFSEENYDSFCLAYMFTYRDFEGGTLGLAWTGDLSQAGGVCEKNGHYRGSKKSLNSGIISILNYGKRVPPAVSHVTFSHEIGHNFGSQHDPDNNKECTPGGAHGNYIMYSRATSGDKINNNKFSPCSLRSINPVLRVKARSRRGCFVEPQAAICGNGVVEEGEECDCGWEEDCRESCCNPMSASPRPGRPPCQLTPTAKCSPSQGPCCNATCEFGYGQKCRDDNGCRGMSRCNGRSAECPPSILKPDRTICNERNVCFKGECSGSICLAYGLESCQCEPGPGQNKTKSCELCCKRPGIDQPCISSFEWNSAPYDIPDQFSRPGTPCNQYTGYCDVFQMCREVDPIGPLATLKNLLLSGKSLSVVKEFMDQYWYMIVLGLIIIILSLIAVIRIFGKSSPPARRRHRRRGSVTKKRPPAARGDDAESPPLPDVTAGAEAAAADPVAAAAAGEQTASERGRLKLKVDDMKRAAAKARQAASHMALSSRASVASGVARVTRRGKRGRSRTGDPDRKRRRKERSKSQPHRRQVGKDGVKVISYSNIPPEGAESAEAAAKSAEAAAKSAEAPAADKRKSLPAALVRRKAAAPADPEKRRSLPKPPGSPQKPRQESPSKQRRSVAEPAAAAARSPERGRRHQKEGDKARLHRSSSHRHRSSKREEKKKRSRSISPTKRPAREKPTAKPEKKPEKPDEKADKKKKFGLRHVTSDNIISDWLGRNAKKEPAPRRHGERGERGERTRKKPIVPAAPMHPNDQVLQWLRTASSEPGGTEEPDGLVSPRPRRRVSQSSSQTSESVRPARPGYRRVTSCDPSLSGSPADAASSRSEERGGSSGGRGSAPRGPPAEERLSFQAAPESVYDLPRGLSPERIYDVPHSASTTPERQLPPLQPPAAADRQMSVPAYQQRPPRPASPSRRPPARNMSVPALRASPERQPAPRQRHSAVEWPAADSTAGFSDGRTVRADSLFGPPPDRPLPTPPRQAAPPSGRQAALAASEASEDSCAGGRSDR